jgi:hypothetical protein
MYKLKMGMVRLSRGSNRRECITITLQDLKVINIKEDQETSKFINISKKATIYFVWDLKDVALISYNVV